MTPNKVANYLFLEMCSHSAAGFADKDLETWYQDGLEFYEELIKANENGQQGAQELAQQPSGEMAIQRDTQMRVSGMHTGPVPDTGSLAEAARDQDERTIL